MQFFIFVILVCFFIFLYCVYVLSNDDFIFLRRDVSMEELFNMVFLGSFISLFVSRLFYGFSHGEVFVNPLVFVLFPYFPGLSLLGAVVGVGAYLIFLKTRKENQFPLTRISDFFSIAFLISLPIGFLGFLMFSQHAMLIKLGIQAAVYFILFIIFLRFFLPRLLNGKFKEGTVSCLFLICFSVVSLVSNIFLKIDVLGYFKNFENIILIFMFLSSSIFLIRQENLLSKTKQFKKEK
jgi:prolipoprotein diacylglyceryltransferase